MPRAYVQIALIAPRGGAGFPGAYRTLLSAFSTRNDPARRAATLIRREKTAFRPSITIIRSASPFRMNFGVSIPAGRLAINGGQGDRSRDESEGPHRAFASVGEYWGDGVRKFLFRHSGTPTLRNSDISERPLGRTILLLRLQPDPHECARDIACVPLQHPPCLTFLSISPD